MRGLKRNMKPFYYCLYKESQEIEDDYGNVTGQYRVVYYRPRRMCANISQATGLSNIEQFGNLENYDKVIVTCEMDCPIDENTVLFVDKEPEYNQDGNPQYDYTVRRVAKSLNSISIAIQRVSVS